ncbi:YcxB family protein [Enterococcus sp. UD-01]|uniref:YcxB family protein n=1 Tax=Enterococcus sp. UD-01 TaxID=3373911 RepID=UPI003833A600
MFEFTSRMTKEDWIAFNKAYVKYAYKKRFRFILVLMILAFLVFLGSLSSLINYVQANRTYLAFFGYSELFSKATFTVMMPIIYFILTAALVFRYFFSIPLAAKRMVEHPENSKMLAERKIVFDDTFIQVFVAKDESKYAWESITKIFENNDYVALFLDQRSCLLFSKKADDVASIRELLNMLDKHCSEKIVRMI